MYDFYDCRSLFFGDALLRSNSDGDLLKFRCFSDGYFCFCKDPCRPREEDFYIWFAVFPHLLDSGLYEIYYLD